MREPVDALDGDLAAFAPLRMPQLYERIAARVIDEIRRGKLNPGSRLPSERELARRLGVGRSTVREAIAALQLQGVVHTRPGSGTMIALDALEQVDVPRPGAHGFTGSSDVSPAALLEARLAIEPRLAAMAAGQGRSDARATELIEEMASVTDLETAAARMRWNETDRLFHRQIGVLADNSVLLAFADHIALLMDEPLWQVMRDESVAPSGRIALHVAEHRMIYEAVVAGRPDAAAFYASEHIKRVRQYMALD